MSICVLFEGCNKAFTAGSSLNVHMCKHTGQKPFKCDVDGCNKTYTTAANLRAHQKRHGNKALTGMEHVIVSLTCRSPNVLYILVPRTFQ